MKIKRLITVRANRVRDMLVIILENLFLSEPSTSIGTTKLDTLTLDKMGLPYEVGQEITLQWRKDLNSSEYITSHFILSGYWEGNYAAMASMAWVSEAFVRSECAGIDQEAQLADGQVFGTGMLHINLYRNKGLEQAAEQILTDTGLSDVSLSANIAYDAAMNENIIREVLPMAICMLLVFASGYLIIYNIFQISVASDIRFYGRLKTLGASGKQLKKMIYGQAGRLSLIGIPIGLLIGYLLGFCLVPVMITGTIGKAETAVSPFIFIGSALFAYLTVLISCKRPARIAGKVSPMEALRYTDTGTSSKRKIKKSTDGASIPKMALANLGRNKKRTVTVICSLTLGLVLLSCVYAKNAYILGTLAVAVGVRMMVAGDYTATFRFTLMPLILCTPVLIVFAILVPYICFRNLEKQSIVERLRATD